MMNIKELVNKLDKCLFTVQVTVIYNICCDVTEYTEFTSGNFKMVIKFLEEYLSKHPNAKLGINNHKRLCIYDDTNHEIETTVMVF